MTAKADIAHYSEHKSTDPEQFTMEINCKSVLERRAGAALLAVCKDIKAVDAAMDIGNYQGFNMRIQFDGWSKEFILSVKHEAVSKVHLGADALEILLVSTICWTVIRRSFQKHNKDWKQSI